jgi:hypothetical protein
MNPGSFILGKTGFFMNFSDGERAFYDFFTDFIV